MDRQYEFQVRARERLKILVPIVFFIIFMLLYMTFHSASEATIVMLSVVYAMTGGVILQWVLGYNFSVAVWVGFIALFGTAVQTGVVMVIYLEEAVERKRRDLGGTLTRAALRDAVIEGALLRLRPKVMTVSTVIAGLLPIMWSTRAGAEVMKPLATPVLGGMASSLLHVLIVTPVIFFWIRERRLGLQHEAIPQPERRGVNRRGFLIGAGAIAMAGVIAALMWKASAPSAAMWKGCIRSRRRSCRSEGYRAVGRRGEASARRVAGHPATRLADASPASSGPYPHTLANPSAPSALSTTTSQIGTFQKASRPRTTSASPKSAVEWMALVQTGW